MPPRLSGVRENFLAECTRQLSNFENYWYGLSLFQSTITHTAKAPEFSIQRMHLASEVVGHF